jgi:hypothetical protein
VLLITVINTNIFEVSLDDFAILMIKVHIRELLSGMDGKDKILSEVEI